MYVNINWWSDMLLNNIPDFPVSSILFVNMTMTMTMTMK